MDIKRIQEIFGAEMDRKEFLLYLGALILAVTGVSGMAKTLLSAEKHPGQKPEKPLGYGSSPYGR
ncbi:MAG: hypothetical protein QM753_05775 [Thermomicrobiales bacterium]